MPEQVRSLRQNANSVAISVCRAVIPALDSDSVRQTGLWDAKDEILDKWSATRKLELPGDIPASHTGSRSTTPLLRNPTDVRHCSQHAGANVDFGDEGAVDWAFLGNLKQLRALLLG